MGLSVRFSVFPIPCGAFRARRDLPPLSMTGHEKEPPPPSRGDAAA